MANLVELFDNIVQMQNLNGVPLANGKMYVYALGRTRLMDTWSDVDGASLNSNPIILDAAGQCHCYVSDDFDYTLVVTDAYDNEIFSIDKYLYSQGSHSHADVAVAPSETIAVSSYHVGETTVYVPYLTGQLGKVYEGIEPIVVNNTEDKISANHVPLGVQDPLYFVQDDEEGCIIGFSGQTVPEGVMTESALGFENDKITGYNGSAFSAGNEYEAGSYVDITDNTISVTGLQPEGDYAYNSALSSKLDVTATGQFLTGLPEDLVYSADITGLATTAQLDEKLDKSDSANFYPMDSNPSGYLTGLPSDLATTGWVDSQGYLTAVDIPESAVWNTTTQTVSANSAAWAGGTANPQIPVTGINGIKISESGDKVVFEVSANYATEDWVTGQGYLTAETDWTNTITAASANAYEQATAAIPAPFDPTYLSGQIDTKLDSAIYAADSGNFLTALPSDLVYTADIQDMATTAQVAEKQDSLTFGYHDTAISSIDETALYDNSAHARINTLAGRISDLSSNKLDTTAFSDVSGTFLTAHQDISNLMSKSESANFYPMTGNPSGFLTGVDLTPYQLTADMTAYQPVGDYLTTSDSANFYTTANESGFITGVPDTYLQNTDLTITDGKVTEISGVPLSAGDELPSGVMNTSALEYNAVNEISGYNGSAIAQYGAEKQWLVHDDTLVHASNSAQYALGVNLSAVAQLLGVDETVLLNNNYTNEETQTFTLPEPLSNFKRIRVAGLQYNNTLCEYEFPAPSGNENISILMHYYCPNGDNAPYQVRMGAYNTTNGLTYNAVYGKFLYCTNTGLTAMGGNTTARPSIQKIYGIGRKV